MMGFESILWNQLVDPAGVVDLVVVHGEGNLAHEKANDTSSELLQALGAVIALFDYGNVFEVELLNLHGGAESSLASESEIDPAVNFFIHYKPFPNICHKPPTTLHLLDAYAGFVPCEFHPVKEHTAV